MSVIALDNRHASAALHHLSLTDRELPVVEFRKLVKISAEQGRKVPIEFSYRGEYFVLEDITSDPHWRHRGTDWEMKLMDFRRIQPTGPNLCRW